MDNANSREYLDKILTQVLENMKRTAHAPSVQMIDVPRDSLGLNDEDEAALDDLDEDENRDKRNTQRRADKYVEKNGELSDSEDEEMEAELNGRPSGSRKRRIVQNYRHIMDVGGNDSGIETGSGMGTPQPASSLPDEAIDEMNVDDDLERMGQSTPSPQNGEQVNGSGAVSSHESQIPDLSAAVDDGDVEMGDADEAEDGDVLNGDIPAAAADLATAPQPMEEESTITVQQQRTPPDSPPTPQDEISPTLPIGTLPETTMTNVQDETVTTVPAPSIPSATTEPEATGATAEEAAIKQEVIGDDEVAKAQEEGRMEREMANAEGEARTEAVSKIEAAGDNAIPNGPGIEKPAGGEGDPETTNEAGAAQES